MTLFCQSVAKYEERVLADVSKLAMRYALLHVDEQAAEDLAQSIVYECLLKMRDGTWCAPRSLAAFVRKIVKRRLQDAKIRKRRSAKRNAIHGRVLEGRTSVWMSAELTTELRELEDVVWSIVLAMPDACSQVWVTIRVYHQTYEEAAEEMEVTRSAVTANLVRAQHLIRSELIARGFDLPPAFASAGRGAARQRVSDD